MRAINRNKIIAVMSAIVVFMVSMCTYSVEANATNINREYWVYNAQTGTYLRKYTLGALSDYNNTGNTRDIIGIDDERQPDWSKSGVCKIILSTGVGTGFVVDEHTIATAAHCVYKSPDDTAGYGYRINTVLLYDTYGNISLQATPIEYHVFEKWVNGSTIDGFDYALITVEEDLSDYMCFNLGVMMDSFATTNTEIYVTGFPGLVMNEEGNLVAANGMYTGEGYLVDNLEFPSQLRIAYTNDTTSGNSGGPVYITETRGNYTYNTVIAVHTTGAGTYNIGTRITTDLLHFYLNNSFKVYE